MICDTCGKERDDDEPSCPHCLKIRLEKFPGTQPRKSGEARPAVQMDLEDEPMVSTYEKKEFPIKQYLPVIIAGVLILIAIIAVVFMNKDTSAVEMPSQVVVEEIVDLPVSNFE